MSKKIYDLRTDSHGMVSPMNDGFFKKTCEISLVPYDENDYALIELPMCFYRVLKRDLDFYSRWLERTRVFQEKKLASNSSSEV